ncbi:hypothetical protein DQ788_19935, partial [Salmonella bongori]|nr:hypothetical protein [Salmonella bongori]
QISLLFWFLFIVSLFIYMILLYLSYVETIMLKKAADKAVDNILCLDIRMPKITAKKCAIRTENSNPQ